MDIQDEITIPGQDARHGETPAWLTDSPVWQAVRDQTAGGQLYLHQAMGLELLGQGHNLVISTGTASGVTSNIKMCKSSKLELTRPIVMASSADTLRRCIRQIAKGGTRERDLRDARRWPFDPGDCQGAGRFSGTRCAGI